MWPFIAEIGRNYRIVFCVSYIKIILNENTYTFRESQVPVGLHFFIQQSYHTHTFQKGQNDPPGLSSVKETEHSIERVENIWEKYIFLQQ